VVLCAAVQVYVSEELAASFFWVYSVKLEGMVFLRNACERLSDNTVSYPIRYYYLSGLKNWNANHAMPKA
jgi:hypothetical protein